MEVIPLLNKICKGWVVEYKFHPTRKWRFDFANPELKIACEQDGGCFIKGRHSRGVGQLKDMEKFNEAVMLGWKVLHYPPEKLMQAVIDVKQLIAEK